MSIVSDAKTDEKQLHKSIITTVIELRSIIMSQTTLHKLKVQNEKIKYSVVDKLNIPNIYTFIFSLCAYRTNEKIKDSVVINWTFRVFKLLPFLFDLASFLS